MAVQGTIVKVSGPLIVASGMADVQMFDVVRVSEKQLIGEVIELRGDRASIQVYEETGGIGPGEPVESTGAPLSVELAPGLIESIYDGIQRPLDKVRAQAGDRITRGIVVDSLDHSRLWNFEPVAKVGDRVEVEMPAQGLVKASMLAYLVPLGMLLLGIWLGMALHGSLGVGMDAELFGVLCGLALGNLALGISNSMNAPHVGWINLLVASLLTYGLGRLHGKREALQEKRLLME